MIKGDSGRAPHPAGKRGPARGAAELIPPSPYVSFFETGAGN